MTRKPLIPFQQFLEKHCACPEAVEWVGSKTLEKCWQICQRPDWMVWLCEGMIGKAGWPTLKDVVWARYEATLDIFCAAVPVELFDVYKTCVKEFANDKDMNSLLHLSLQDKLDRFSVSKSISWRLLSPHHSDTLKWASTFYAEELGQCRSFQEGKKLQTQAFEHMANIIRQRLWVGPLPKLVEA